MNKPNIITEHARAPYAADINHSRGRLHDEISPTSRSPYQRDRDRIIHSTAFRRLKQKTQVFVAHEGDHHRTRLTHSLEVAQIARTMARQLGADEDLTEALALAHDLGHPPFGHAGEDELANCMRNYNGFDHNIQTFRLLTQLEARYPTFDGLNLTWETLEGVVKHNGPVDKPVPLAFENYCKQHDLWLNTYAGLEAQIAAISDDIAYNNHDIDDGLRARLFRIEHICDDVPLVADVYKSVNKAYPTLKFNRKLFELNRRLIGLMVRDCLQESQVLLSRLAPKTADDIRNNHGPVISFSCDMQEQITTLKAFLYDNMYRHTDINRKMSQARRMIRALFTLFLEEPDVLPTQIRQRVEEPQTDRTARIICDYIAGMTDSAVMAEHRRLFNLDQTLYSF